MKVNIFKYEIKTIHVNKHNTQESGDLRKLNKINQEEVSYDYFQKYALFIYVQLYPYSAQKKNTTQC